MTVTSHQVAHTLYAYETAIGDQVPTLAVRIAAMTEALKQLEDMKNEDRRKSGSTSSA